MSSVSRGAQRVGSVLSELARVGYRCVRVSASGQTRGARREERCISGDVLAFAPSECGLPHLQIEVGGSGKRLAVTFATMRAAGVLPGFVLLVVRFVRRRKWYYVDADSRFTSAEKALEALRA